MSKRFSVRLTDNFSSEDHGSWWHVQSSERKRLSIKDAIGSKPSFKYEGEINTFPDKQQLGECDVRRPDLQEIYIKNFCASKDTIKK